jgi:hypothetical protein
MAPGFETPIPSPSHPGHPLNGQEILPRITLIALMGKRHDGGVKPKNSPIRAIRVIRGKTIPGLSSRFPVFPVIRG